VSRRLVPLAVVVALAAAVSVATSRSGHRHDPAVVRVELDGPTAAADVATGFVVARGRVVTVAHVLEPGRRLVVRAGEGRALRAHLLRTDRRDDLALVAVPGLSGPAASLGGRTVERLLVRRAGRTAPLRAELARRIRATVRGPDWGPYRRPGLELRAAVEPGDSGAPLVDRGGNVAGVLFARSNNAPRTAYAVDVSAVATLVHPR
jgi:S1-C subfamily serine protease